MIDARIGRTLRVLRIRRGLSQVELGGQCGLSAATISRIERGLLATTRLESLRRAFAVVEAEVALDMRWAHGPVDRLLDRAHAELSDAVARRVARAGWQVSPEVTFAHYGERGAIDLLGWHAATSMMLIVELKSSIQDVGGLLRQVDRYRRLAPHVARERGLQPSGVGVWVVVQETRSGRARLAAAQAVVRAALPDDGHRVEAWLARPSGALSALSFMPISRPVIGERKPRRPTHRSRA
ncbi:MAG: helix-turn-helix domain-containing protein [Chloroflexota bacterium]